jgi:hypothetical protein
MPPKEFTMTTTTVHIQAAQPRTAPRLANRIGETAAAALQLFAHTRRAARAAIEAARTRQLAREFNALDPRMAAELYAAADRHDLRNGNF